MYEWIRLAEHDARNDEHWVRAGTYYVVTPDWPVDRLEVITVPVVAEVEITEDCPVERLRYRVLRLQRYDGLTLPEYDRASYASAAEWLYHGEVYELLHEARSAAQEHHRAAVGRSIEESAGRAAERLLQVMSLYRQGQRQGAA